MTAAATEATTTRATVQPRRPRRRQRAPYLYLVPAFIVMGVITVYPLVYQVWMSFTDFGIQNLREGSAPPTWVGARELHRHHHQPALDPELRLRPAAAVQPGLGVLERHHPRDPGRRDRPAPAHQGPVVQAVLPLPVHHPGRHPADHRGDGLEEHVRPDPRRHQRAARRDRRHLRDPAIGVRHRLAAPDPGPVPAHPAAARLLRDARHEHLAGLAAQRGRRHRARCRASRASCTRRPRSTAPVAGSSSRT